VKSEPDYHCPPPRPSHLSGQRYRSARAVPPPDFISRIYLQLRFWLHGQEHGFPDNPIATMGRDVFADLGLDHRCSGDVR